MALGLKLEVSSMSLMVMYAPIDVSDSCPRRDIRIFWGEFNALFGYEVSVHPHGSGADASSENGRLFQNFARSQKWRMVLGSSTLTHIVGRGTEMRVMQPRRLTISSLALERSSRTAGCSETYRCDPICCRRQRVADIQQISCGYPPGTLQNSPAVYHLDRLREVECARGFAEAISGRFTALDNLTDPVVLWETFKRETLEASQESIGERSRARQKFISLETLKATDACHTSRLTGDWDLHRSEVRRTRSPLRTDKLNSKPSSQVTAVRSVSGQIVSDPVAVPERWDEYFEQLYQVDRPTVKLYAGSVEIPLPDPPISEDPPSLTEVKGVISKLKSREAAGFCGIPAELLKAGGEPMAWRVHVVLAAIRQSDHLLRHQRLEQSEFTPGKSTINRTKALQVIVERCREFGSGLLAAYIDLKKAFDTVHWDSSWEIFRFLKLNDLKLLMVAIIDQMVVFLAGTSNISASLDGAVGPVWGSGRAHPRINTSGVGQFNFSRMSCTK
ncbi:uncharacterized protein [Penaeus vannamei]|uniref:uncharacterized protein n=1 Tax=Penaeus vannamei TaxID=6689 RepID=UPI00387F4B3C